MKRSNQFIDGAAWATRVAVAFLHARAEGMRSAEAATVLNCAAHDLGAAKNIVAQGAETISSENERLKALLKEVRDKSLVYWKPQTMRDTLRKAAMWASIDMALAPPHTQGGQEEGSNESAPRDC